LTTTCDTDIGSFGDKALSSGKTNAASAASDKSSEASFRKAVKVNPSELETYINLGIVLYDCGKLEEASAQYQQALHLDPSRSDVPRWVRETGSRQRSHSAIAAAD